MDRRHVCRLAALGLAGLAGCTDASAPSGPATPPVSPTPSPTPTATPRPGIEVASRRPRENEDGQFVLVMEFRNTADGPRRATYVVTVAVESEDFSASQERTVELEGGATQTVEFVFDVQFSAWADGGSVSFQRKADE